jgi:hypothetical protein
MHYWKSHSLGCRCQRRNFERTHIERDKSAPCSWHVLGSLVNGTRLKNLAHRGRARRGAISTRWAPAESAHSIHGPCGLAETQTPRGRNARLRTLGMQWRRRCPTRCPLDTPGTLPPRLRSAPRAHYRFPEYTDCRAHGRTVSTDGVRRVLNRGSRTCNSAASSRSRGLCMARTCRSGTESGRRCSLGSNVHPDNGRRRMGQYDSVSCRSIRRRRRDCNDGHCEGRRRMLRESWTKACTRRGGNAIAR